MNCPNCNGRLKRVRTIDHSNQVIRYNRCLNCGDGVKTIEMPLRTYEHSLSDARILAIRAERKVEQLELNLDMIRTAFRQISDAVAPIKAAADKVTTDGRLEKALQRKGWT